MNITIREAHAADYPTLVALWERAVRATHTFLSEADLQQIEAALPTDYFPHVQLHALQSDGTIAGFIGLTGDAIEMLFVDDHWRGRGIGSHLLRFALQRGATKVDVNAQNPRALTFYQKHGFHIVSRDEHDPDGRPYPILHLSL